MNMRDSKGFLIVLQETAFKKNKNKKKTLLHICCVYKSNSFPNIFLNIKGTMQVRDWVTQCVRNNVGTRFLS